MSANRRWLLAGLALSAAGLAFGSKLQLIRAYGSDVPYMDEWDAVGRALLIPRSLGTLHAGNFLMPHNEHRIVLSRVISYLLAVSNRQWDPLLEMTVGAAIHAGFCAALLLFARTLVRGFRFLVVALATTALFLLPFDWENTLQGIQSQFYLLEWGALGTLVLCVPSAPLSARWWAGVLVGAASLGTMASGFIAGAAALALLGVGAALRRHLTARAAVGAAVLALLCFAGYLAVVHVPGHERLRAHSIWAWTVAAASGLAWPVWDWPLLFLVMQLPIGLVAARCARARSMGPGESVLIALAVWVWMQTAVIALGRANEGVFRSPRYTDLYAVGSFCNAVALALLWRSGGRARALGLLAAGWVALFAAGLWMRTRDVHSLYLGDYPRLKAIERRNVRAFLATGDAAILWAAGKDELPYPSRPDLEMMLRAPGIVFMFPMGIRTPLHVAPRTGSAGFELQDPAGILSDSGARVWIAKKGPARFVSQPLPLDILPFVHLEVAGSRGMDAAALRIETAAAGQSMPPFALAEGLTHSADVAVPKGEAARLVVDVPAGDHWFAFAEPVELGRGSWATHWLLRRSDRIVAAAAILFAAALVGLALSDRSSRTADA
jgi:hypothetical protein